MLTSDRVQKLFALVPGEHVAALMAAFSDSGSTEDRVAAVAAVLRGSGQSWRDEAGAWIAELLSVEDLVPNTFSHWRPLVHDCMAFVASHISTERLAPKIVEQIQLPATTPPEVRLGLVIAKTPGLQKLGQVLARTRKLSPGLRAELQKLENGISDSSIDEVQGIVAAQLGPALAAYKVEMASALLSEASVSAIVEFTWWNHAAGRREEGVFKVIKPHVPLHYAEDLLLLQHLAEYLSAGSRYYFASREVVETLEEVRMLLQREVDFRREQATLAEVRRVYKRSSSRAPKPIPELCTDTVTAISLERGVKVTEAFRNNRAARRTVAAQVIEALIADPIFSDQDEAVFHADPHAGNLLYDQRGKRLIVLDWALTGRLSRHDRRWVARLIVMMTFRDVGGVRQAIHALSRGAAAEAGVREKIVDRCVDEFFAQMPFVCSPGALDAMRLLDRIGVEGVRFPASLVLIRKVLFTLDGVLHDIAGGDVRIDTVVSREFAARLLRGGGSLPPPFRWTDYVAAQMSALRYVSGFWAWSN
jgi:ubiquinone biosynthesis protein